MTGINFKKDGDAILIVITRGYDDDQNIGHKIFYTSQGGQSSLGSGVQIKDREMAMENRTLAKSNPNQSPLTVIRGS